MQLYTYFIVHITLKELLYAEKVGHAAYMQLYIDSCVIRQYTL